VHVSVQRGVDVESFPALVDEGASVALRTFATATGQGAAMRAGIRRLLLLTLPSPLRAVQAGLPNDAKLLLARAPHGSAAALLEDCLTAAVDVLLTEAGGPVWTAGEFERLAAAVGAGLEATTADVVRRTLRVLAAAADVERAMSRTTSLALVPSLSDAREQFTALVHPGFVTETGLPRLGDLLRYLQGISRRLATVAENAQRDRVRMAEFARVRDAYTARLARAGSASPELADVRWLLEELRLQKFAPGVPTARPVSDERVLKALAAIN
jgi:ATP-dependent helicase HrpA